MTTTYSTSKIQNRGSIALLSPPQPPPKKRAMLANNFGQADDKPSITSYNSSSPSHIKSQPKYSTANGSKLEYIQPPSPSFEENCSDTLETSPLTLLVKACSNLEQVNGKRRSGLIGNTILDIAEGEVYNLQQSAAAAASHANNHLTMEQTRPNNLTYQTPTTYMRKNGASSAYVFSDECPAIKSGIFREMNKRKHHLSNTLQSNTNNTNDSNNHKTQNKQCLLLHGNNNKLSNNLASSFSSTKQCHINNRDSRTPQKKFAFADPFILAPIPSSKNGLRRSSPNHKACYPNNNNNNTYRQQHFDHAHATHATNAHFMPSIPYPYYDVMAAAAAYYAATMKSYNDNHHNHHLNAVNSNKEDSAKRTSSNSNNLLNGKNPVSQDSKPERDSKSTGRPKLNLCACGCGAPDIASLLFPNLFDLPTRPNKSTDLSNEHNTGLLNSERGHNLNVPFPTVPYFPYNMPNFMPIFSAPSPFNFPQPPVHENHNQNNGACNKTPWHRPAFLSNSNFMIPPNFSSYHQYLYPYSQFLYPTTSMSQGSQICEHLPMPLSIDFSKPQTPNFETSYGADGVKQAKSVAQTINNGSPHADFSYNYLPSHFKTNPFFEHLMKFYAPSNIPNLTVNNRSTKEPNHPNISSYNCDR